MYNGVKVLDVHGHVSAPDAGRAHLLNMMASNTARPSPIRDGFSNRSGFTEEDFRASAQRHVDYIDERNIDVQLIGPRPFTMLGWMEDHLIPAWTSYVNDSIARQCQLFPERFLGACQLPQQSEAPDLGNCLGEIDRCVKEFGFAAVYASPDPGGRRTTPGMDQPYWFPVYEKCQSMGLPIIVHGTNSLDKRYRNVPQNYQLGFLTEQYLAGQVLSHSDVFERYPELRIIICHCGGALNRFIPTDPHLSQKDLSNNLFYDTCGYDLVFLEAAIKQRGVNRMCFGSEAPGSGRAVRPETGRTSDDLVPVIGALEFLSEEERVGIFNANPSKVVPALAKLSSSGVLSS